MSEFNRRTFVLASAASLAVVASPLPVHADTKSIEAPLVIMTTSRVWTTKATYSLVTNNEKTIISSIIERNDAEMHEALRVGSIVLVLGFTNPTSLVFWYRCRVTRSGIVFADDQRTYTFESI